MDIWNTRYKKNPDIVYRVIAGEALLVPVSQKPEELGCIYSLNETAARIWELLDGKKTLKQITDTISLEFDAQEEEIAKDIEEIIGELLAQKVICEHGRPAV
jgi:hypothetical protein